MKYYFDIDDKDLPEFYATLRRFNMGAEILKINMDLFHLTWKDLELIMIERLKEVNPEFYNKIVNEKLSINDNLNLGLDK